MLIGCMLLLRKPIIVFNKYFESAKSLCEEKKKKNRPLMELISVPQALEKSEHNVFGKDFTDLKKI